MTKVKDNTLEVNEENKVVGSAYIRINEEYYVSIGVYSYEYDDGSKINHIPSATLSGDNGIIHEMELYDTQNPKKAIENCIESGKYLAENYKDYL